MQIELEETKNNNYDYAEWDDTHYDDFYAELRSLARSGCQPTLSRVQTLPLFLSNHHHDHHQIIIKYSSKVLP